MNSRAYIVVCSLAALAVLTACNIPHNRRVNGSANIISKNYSFNNFKGIAADGDLDITVKQDSVFSVKVSTDDNLFQYLRVEVNDGILSIDNIDNINLDPTSTIKVVIGMPHVRSIDVSGSTTIRTEGKIQQDDAIELGIHDASSGTISLRAPKVNINVSDASTLNINGETRDVTAEVSDASTLNAFDLHAENSDVTVSDIGHAKVFASVMLKAKASDASGIRYKGNPNVTSNSEDVASIKKDDEK